jgi:hypothetical protein
LVFDAANAVVAIAMTRIMLATAEARPVLIMALLAQTSLVPP